MIYGIDVGQLWTWKGRYDPITPVRVLAVTVDTVTTEWAKCDVWRDVSTVNMASFLKNHRKLTDEEVILWKLT